MKTKIYFLLLVFAAGCGLDNPPEKFERYYDDPKTIEHIHEVIKAVIRLDSLEITHPSEIRDFLPAFIAPSIANSKIPPKPFVPESEVKYAPNFELIEKNSGLHYDKYCMDHFQFQIDNSQLICLDLESLNLNSGNSEYFHFDSAFDGFGVWFRVDFDIPLFNNDKTLCHIAYQTQSTCTFGNHRLKIEKIHGDWVIQKRHSF